ncbi:deaminase [Kitasatospora sp. MMS16-BH015]|uniref:dihydrofolate reductase family protein n=1 Tax=Kitasatospora sp. MMS16-BH015 TaxID=2018025 RepID=UPI000CA1B555|nr:dihydrofolate reductase family protein [Kitasatospora sp. MMS16-BH015]AUG75129.1 deaminase [Kitasatospora sp. MMS16-BH015]
MRKLTYYVGATIDGFIADPDGSFGFFPLADDILKHIGEEYPETLPTHVRSALGIVGANRHFDTVVMGRATYDPALKAGITSPYAHLRQYVVSGSLPLDGAPGVEIVRTDPVGVVRRLKRQDGLKIWLAGGARLAGELLPEIDELVVKTYPLVIGSGVPLFTRDFAVAAFRRTSGRVFDSGAAIAVYQRD